MRLLISRLRVRVPGRAILFYFCILQSLGQKLCFVEPSPPPTMESVGGVCGGSSMSGIPFLFLRFIFGFFAGWA